MKINSLISRFIVMALALVSAGLACSAPAVQTEAPTAAVGENTAAPGEAVTQGVLVVTATPEGPSVVTATPDGSGAGNTAATAEDTSAGNTAAPTEDTSAAACNYDSVYMSDLTIPDGTEMTPGTAFVKTWRVQNNGCKAWPDGTSLAYLSGKKMGGGAGAPVPQTAVSGTQDISINLTAPSADGNAEGYWQMRTPDGIQFGDKLSVKIKVASAPGPTAIPTWVLVPVKPDLPIVPRALANFTLSYAGVKPHCILSGQQIWVKVKNTGAVDFESRYARVEIPAGTTLGESSSNDPFLPSFDCGSGQSKLASGDTAWMVAGGSIKSFVAGATGKVVIKLCGLDDLGGACSTKSVSFTID